MDVTEMTSSLSEVFKFTVKVSHLAQDVLPLAIPTTEKREMFGVEKGIEQGSGHLGPDREGCWDADYRDYPDQTAV